MTRRVSPEVSSRAVSAPPTFSNRAVVLAAVAEADQEQPAGALAFRDERLGDRRGFALEALGLGGAGGDGAGRGIEAAEAVGDHVLAPHRKGEREGPGGTFTGEADFHGRWVLLALVSASRRSLRRCKGGRAGVRHPNCRHAELVSASS